MMSHSKPGMQVSARNVADTLYKNIGIIWIINQATKLKMLG